ncbi:MAG: hypothetical protein ACTSQO_06545 [Candidatus Helarchaeota archaeon]
MTHIKRKISFFIFTLLELFLFPIISIGIIAISKILKERIRYSFREYGRDDTVKMLTFGGMAGIFRMLIPED